MTKRQAGSSGITEVAERVTLFTSARFGAGAALQKLLGDASDRSFFRLRAPGLSPLILIAHREPFELDRLPFFLHTQFLHQIGAAVPQIVASYPAEGILLVQDLGDDMLQGHLGGCDPSRRRFLYLQAVQIIAFLQEEGTRALTPELPAASTALDQELLLYELRFFAEHYVRGLMGSPLVAAQAADLDDWFVLLSREVAGHRRVLCHRDFHSRNLMVKGDRLFMVDFQDARLGPYTYDLASLLRDSYVDLPEDLVQEAIQFYREASRCPETTEAFETAFARTCLQRNIKAIGTFASQAMLRNNRGYLQYIPRMLAAVRSNLRREEAAGGSGSGSGDIGGGAAAKAGEILEIFSGPLDYR